MVLMIKVDFCPTRCFEMSTPAFVDLLERKAVFRQKMMEAKTSKEAAEYKRLFRQTRNQILLGRK